MSNRVAAGKTSRFLAGGGEMGERIRAYDWESTTLGSPEAWPQSLKTAAGILVNSGYPMYLAWGSEFVQLYNDAFRPILGETKHPAALGATTVETFPEIWDEIGPMFRTVMAEARPSTFTDLMMPLNRYGFAEECFFVFSYSPVLDESGRTAGVFVTVLETSDRVLRDRRQRVLKDISAIQAQQGRDDIFRRAVETIGGSPQDAPFAAICARDDHGAWTVLARHGAPGLADEAILDTLRDMPGESSAPLTLAEGVVCEPWPEAVTRLVGHPIVPPGATSPAGMLVMGLSPRLRWDDAYADYCETAASNLAAVIADAEAFEVERRRAEALAEIDRAKTAFFSNVSHEFRTPLTLMLGPLEDALQDQVEPLADRRREQIETVHRNALRLLRLVNSLLDFSRIEAGRAKATFLPTDLVGFTTDLASSFRSVIERAGLDLTVQASDLPSPVHVDRDMWENIVLNLMSNAFKFTLEGSIRVEIGSSADNRAACVTVRDTGIGIPSDQLPQLFERFHRVEGAVGRSIEGSGIGLALVQELVKLHGGDLAVASEVGRGTAFTITIPYGCEHLDAERIGTDAGPAVMGQRSDVFIAEALRWLPEIEAAEDLGPEASRAPAGARSQGGRRVLVVDDNADMRDYLRHLLEGHGYRVELAGDGLEALDRIDREIPDLVLSDIMMPRLDGFGLLAKLRAREETKSVPFVAVSARAGEEAKIEGLGAGADDYIVKPFSGRELFARVDSAIELSRLRRRSRDALHEEYRRLRRLFEQAPGFMATTRGPDHVFEFANAAYRRIVGNRELIGRTVADALPEVRDQGFIELLDRVYRTGEPYLGENVTVRLQEDAGSLARDVVVNFVYEAITDAAGEITGVFVEGHDVTPQHRANQHLQLVVSELNHRVKNTLAIVQSISRQTFQGDRASAEERNAFAARLSALASAHDLLTREHWGAPTLEALARELVGAHDRAAALEIAGPEVRLCPRTAVTMSMALHELVTNAIKYGALSVPDGRIDLGWSVAGEDAPRLVLTWRESGGPPVAPPTRRGFGSRLIERALAAELKGIVRLDFRPDGLVCELDAPLPQAADTALVAEDG